MPSLTSCVILVKLLNFSMNIIPIVSAHVVVLNVLIYVEWLENKMGLYKYSRETNVGENSHKNHHKNPQILIPPIQILVFVSTQNLG